MCGKAELPWSVSNPDCTNPCKLPRKLIRIKTGVAWSLPSVQVLGRSTFQVWLCVLNAFAWLTKSPGSNLYLICAFGWAHAAGDPLMLKNHTTYGTAAQTGNLNSALAMSLLDLALICSIILRKFSDPFFMPSYFEKYHFPIPCAWKRVVIEEQMSDLVPAW